MLNDICYDYPLPFAENVKVFSILLIKLYIHLSEHMQWLEAGEFPQ